MKTSKKYLWLLGCIGIFTVFFVVLVLGGYFYSSTASAASQSVIFIREPNEGDRLEAGQPVQVRALARDDHKITRIELWVDGQLFDAQTSNTPGGINPFPLLTTWYPQPGAHTLIARAFNSRGATPQATITVEALALADRDADGVADEADACPDQAGNPAADGCPDRDFDGIPDASDVCPDEAGMPDSGCPAPSAGDRDGDGLLDAADACPDEAGSPLADGCRDADGDGVGDTSDACPAEPGGGADGCPGGDSGVSSEPEPEPGGVLPEPIPGEEPPAPEEDVPEAGFEFPFFWQAYPISMPLEVEAYSMFVLNRYDTVWCYLRLGDEDPRRYEFDTLGSQNWDIAASLGGENSIRLLHVPTEPLEIWAQCFGANAGGEPEDLGVITAVHPSQEWDGRSFMGHPEGENLFSISYHICSPSCDETILQTPLLAPITTGPTGNGPYTLHWQWNGNNSEIDGFLIKRFTVDWDEDNIFVFDPSMRTLDLADYMPACGETINFRINAYRNTETGTVYSPASNIESWVGDTCEYTASVIFTTIDVHNPPEDEDGLHRPGPIYGEFWVSDGTTFERLPFDACWRPAGPFASLRDCEGLKLEMGTYVIGDIFDWIDTQMASCLGNGCHSNSFYTPSTTVVSIPFEDGSDITIGGWIMDCDTNNPDDVVFEEQETLTIRASDLDYLTEPIVRTINGEHVNLNYFIRLGH